MPGKQNSILHIGKFYPPHRGGMETHLRDLVLHQSQRFRVEVLVSNSSMRGTTEDRDGACIRRVGRLGTIASMPLSPGFLVESRKLHPNLIHLHVPNPLGALAVLTSGFRGPIVVTHHADVLGRRMLRRVTDPIVRSVYDRAAVILATSERYLASSVELADYRSKCKVIPLGINPDEHSRPAVAGERTGVTDGRAALLSIGRLVPYKGFEYLVDAMTIVKNAVLRIIGDGPLRAALSRRIEEAQLGERVQIIPAVDDVRPYLAGSDLFVLPSVTRAEAFGVVQLEAMAYGVPVINTLIDSGVPEVSVDQVTGITVPPGNSEALAAAISKLIGDRDLREAYGAAARHRALGLYDARVMAARVEAIYEAVLS